MSIGILHPYFDVMGGAEMTTISLIDALIQEKTNTILYCVIPPDISETDSFQVKKVRQKKFPLFWRYQRIAETKKLFEIADDDILFVMSGGLTLEESRAKRTYLYCHSTFVGELDFVKRNVGGIMGIYARIIQKNIKESLEMLKKDNVSLISNSRFTQNEIKKNFKKESVVIYPPVKIEKFKKFQTAKKENKVITVSRFSAEKNLDSAVSIMNQSGMKCEIVGNAKYKNQLKVLSILQGKKLENVKIYNNVSHNRIAELLSTAKVYIHTAPETFGISVVEAIASGCIPIVPDNSAHKETVPFSELRFASEAKAVHIIKDAINGNLDYLLPNLQQHVLQFSERSFQKNMLELII